MKKILITICVLSTVAMSAAFADETANNTGYQLPMFNYAPLNGMSAYGNQSYGAQQTIDHQQTEVARQEWMQNHPESEAKIKQRQELKQQWAQTHPGQYQPAPPRGKFGQKPIVEKS